jgi:hypothetical protein
LANQKSNPDCPTSYTYIKLEFANALNVRTQEYFELPQYFLFNLDISDSSFRTIIVAEFLCRVPFQFTYKKIDFCRQPRNSWACIKTMRLRSSTIILSDGSIVYATKLILKSNKSKNVIVYLSNIKIIIVHMCSFLQNNSGTKQKMLTSNKKLLITPNFTETD